jgi:hypothetical protein
MMARISCSRTSNEMSGQRLDATEAQADVADVEDDVTDVFLGHGTSWGGDGP